MTGRIVIASASTGTPLGIHALIAPSDHRPVVVHVVQQMMVGGMENGLVNFVNHAPEGRYRHVIISMTTADPDFCRRIRRKDVAVVSLHKREGQDWSAYGRLFQIMRMLRPDILHTRTLATFEGQFYGAFAGARVRIHGEHGKASSEGAGNKRLRIVRRIIQPLVHHYTTVSRDLANYLIGALHIPNTCVTPVFNGVDTERFSPRRGGRPGLPDGFANDDSIIVGTIGRMYPVKDQCTLVRAFLQLIEKHPEVRQRLRLVLVGGGPLQEPIRQMLCDSAADHLAWLPGERSNVPEILKTFDIFVLPSLSEGMSNAVLEAMATGLPVIATRVGGNPELVEDGRSGVLVEPTDTATLADAIHGYGLDPSRRLLHGRQGRLRAENEFSLRAMVNGYLRVYDNELSLRRRYKRCVA